MSSQSMVNEGISYKTVRRGLYKALQTPTLVYNLIGYSGIGKTAIVRDVVNELGGKVEEINSSLLQAGDLAMPVKHEDKDNKPMVKYIVNEMITGINNQAREDKDNLYVLFFDEFNRADAEVQSDLMNLILQRQLFDVVLEDNVRIVTAQNPDRTTEGFEHTDYDVHEVDEATASRVVDIRMRYSASDWLDFGTTYNKEQERHNVHPMVTGYIANGNEDMLLKFDPDKRNTPSPRSWTRVGELLYDLGIEDFDGADDDLLNFVHEAIVGTVGSDSATSFISFAETFTSYIRVESWVNSDEEEFEELLERFTIYDNTKQVFMVEGLIKHMLETKENIEDDELKRRVAMVLGLAPADTVTNQLRHIAQEFTTMCKGQMTKIEVAGKEGEGVKEETLPMGMITYINFVNSNPKLKEKQEQALLNTRKDTRENI